MPINTDLLLEIREQITAHPETHDQREWGAKTECGTAHCIAGWAAVLTHARLDWRYGALYYVNDKQDVGDYAGAVMGLDPLDAHYLFYLDDNTKALTFLDRLIEEGKNAA